MCYGYKHEFHQSKIESLKAEVSQKQTDMKDKFAQIEEIEKNNRSLESNSKQLEDEITRLKEEKADLESTRFISIVAAEKEAGLQDCCQDDLFAQSKL